MPAELFMRTLIRIGLSTPDAISTCSIATAESE